jgi:uncharacterized repeat protein (TIGR02543 family)
MFAVTHRVLAAAVHALAARGGVLARLTLVLVALACGDGAITSHLAVASVAVTPATATVAPGGTTQLTASARDASGGTVPGVVIEWSSNNTSVATVSNNGNVTAVSLGTASIVAAGGGKNGVATITVAQPSFVLTVLGVGTGSGTVFSTPAGIACAITDGSGSCSATFSSGTVVTLTATAGGGQFTGWGGACAGTGPCQLTMSEARSVTASFAPPTFTLTVTGGGTTGSGDVGAPAAGGQGAISCGITFGVAGGVCSRTYPSGTVVTLTATPGIASNFAVLFYTFDGWSGACTGTSRTCTVTMTQNQTVRASFSF